MHLSPSILAVSQRFVAQALWLHSYYLCNLRAPHTLAGSGFVFVFCFLTVCSSFHPPNSLCACPSFSLSASVEHVWKESPHVMCPNIRKLALTAFLRESSSASSSGTQVVSLLLLLAETRAMFFRAPIATCKVRPLHSPSPLHFALQASKPHLGKHLCDVG